MVAAPQRAVAFRPVPPASEPPETHQATDSAVIVAIREAEAVVASHRCRFDAAAAWGVPAHVTILYPFVEPAALTDEVVDRLREAVGAFPPFVCAFKEARWFGQDVLWLAPDPATPFRAMTEGVVRAFPAQLPYGGAFGNEVVPHLTVAETRLASSVDEVAAVEEQVLPLLPFDAPVTEALLIAGTALPDSWCVVAHLPLRA